MNEFIDSLNKLTENGIEAVKQWPRTHNDSKGCFAFPRVEFDGKNMTARCDSCGWNLVCKHQGFDYEIETLGGQMMDVRRAVRYAHVKNTDGGKDGFFCGANDGDDHQFDKLYQDLSGLMSHIKRHHPKSDFNQVEKELNKRN